MAAKVVHMTDEHIIKGCCRQDRNSQKQLYEKYFESLSLAAMRYIKDGSLVYDLVHEGFLKIFRNIDKYHGKGSFEGWMKRIVINCCLDYLRKHKKRPPSASIAEGHDIRVDTDVVANMQAEFILEMIQQLSSIHRTVFNLNVIEGYPHREIAAMLDIKESTSRAYLTEAKKQIRELLVKNGAAGERRLSNG